MNNIQLTAGAYLVSEIEQGKLQVFSVGKDKTCSCGVSACRHVQAVADYLRAGGERAPEAGENVLPAASSSALVCPLCGAGVRVNGPYWRCERDASHYWLWRAEQSGIKAFLTQPHPAKMGAFYEQTLQEREEFLAAAQRRHAEYLKKVAAAQRRQFQTGHEILEYELPANG
jgi:hypothetical protein